MERLPLFISLGSLLIWALVALFMNKNLRMAARGIGLGLALVQLGSAIWAAARIFGDTPGVQYSVVWFALTAKDVFEIKFVVDAAGVVFWVALSLFTAVTAYFSLLGQIKGTRTQHRGEAVTVPLLTIGALCALTSANFISYYFGWALIASLGFLAISFSAPNRDDRASASFRYLILNILPEVLFLAGILGCYAVFETLSFNEINEKALADAPAWPIMCLVAGTMLRSLQIPLMQCARYLASAKSAATPVFFLGNAILSATLFAKLFPAICATEDIQYFAIIPALTAIAAAVMALPEQEPAQLVGWLVSYVCASVFLSGLVGSYDAAQALALTGSIGVFLLASALTEFSQEDRPQRWLAGVALLMMTGLPITGWGWARYLEYAGLIHNEGQLPSFHWILLGLKLLADLLMGIVLWGVVRERWMVRETTSKKVKWEIIVPLTILALSCLSIAVGGRPFGGLVGRATVDAFPGLVWFEKFLTPPGGAAKTLSSGMDLLGTDADFFARLLMVGVLVVPAMLAGLWIFRDRKSLEDFRAFCARVVRRLGQVPDQDSKLWSWVMRPLNATLGSAAAFFDSRILDRLMADIWVTPARFVRKVFLVFENKVLDQQLIDGLAEAVASIGKSLRLVQNGQVQFYFALGLILMGAVVIKFVVVGG